MVPVQPGWVQAPGAAGPAAAGTAGAAVTRYQQAILALSGRRQPQ